MRVDHHAFRDSKCHAKDDVGSLARHARQLEQLIHFARHLPAVFFDDQSARSLNTLCLVPEESGRMNHLLEFRNIGFSKLLRRFVFPEQCGRNRVDGFVGALCGEYCCDQQLKRVSKIQCAFCVRIRRFQTRVNLFGFCEVPFTSHWISCWIPRQALWRLESWFPLALNRSWSRNLSTPRQASRTSSHNR